MGGKGREIVTKAWAFTTKGNSNPQKPHFAIAMAVQHLVALLFLACFSLSIIIGFASICTFIFLTLVKERLRALDRSHRRRVLLPLSPDLDERPLFILGFFHPYW
ncbi:hypothetical protein BC937DRAFT_87021 [Endogone sp. FLAS-F59071]|nr:hypothetical protein BC937DRAFT_87021 [Endogone sp. FLAS-F59071]|eukprot:RUS19731.1 hypothetical protein BC937DRAFT_87021 [Endogone sp. FLAS-F59071]